MDVATQHNRFRTLVREVVEQRKSLFPDSLGGDWVVLCHDSLAAFHERFPDRAACERLLAELEARDQETRAELDATAERIRRDGLSYQDEELLRYDLPGPE